jgi:hypothetical protein
MPPPRKRTREPATIILEFVGIHTVMFGSRDSKDPAKGTLLPLMRAILTSLGFWAPDEVPLELPKGFPLAVSDDGMASIGGGGNLA